MLGFQHGHLPGPTRLTYVPSYLRQRLLKEGDVVDICLVPELVYPRSTPQPNCGGMQARN